MSRLNYFFMILCLVFVSYSFCTVKVVLDPYGDTQQPGRIISHSFERTITLQLAQEIKKHIESKYSDVHIYLTRSAGEQLITLQQAQFSNRLNADLFIHIQCYQTDQTKPTWTIYYQSNGSDLLIKKSDLSWYPYDRAYEINKDKTLLLANAWSNILQSYTNLFLVQGPYGLPLKPLCGILAPAFLIEIGLKQADDWHQCIIPLAQSIKHLSTQPTMSSCYTTQYS